MAFIYVDASYHPISGLAGIGIPYKSLSKKIKAKDSLSAELIAVIKGIVFANEYDIVYTDCLVIVKAIKQVKLLVRHEELCGNLYRLLTKKKNISVKWVKRDHPSQRKADKLARLAAFNCRPSNGSY